MITHRCAKSISHHISIRFDKGYSYGEDYGWWLRKIEFDPDFDSYSLRLICKIRYCPFCGEVLPELSKSDLQ